MSSGQRMIGMTGPNVSSRTSSHVVGHVVDDGGGIERALAVVAVQQLGALRDGIVDARLEGARRALVDDRADVGVGVHGVAALELPGLGQHDLDEPVGDLLHHQDALDRRAALAGVLGGALHGQLRRLVEVRVLHDDQRVVAAELQHQALVAGLLGDVLADLDAAGEGDDVGVRVGDHGVAHGARIAGHDRQHLRRQPCLVEDVGQQQRGERRQLRGLGHHAVVGGDRRGDLVADHVEGMVERRDGRDAARARGCARCRCGAPCRAE